MDARRLIIMPRLHRELVNMPAGLELPPEAQSLWPGLPGVPAGFFCPDAYPWSPAQAAACVRDFESMASDGAKGRPVQALAQNELLGNAKDLSPEERRALQQWRQAEENGIQSGNAVAAPLSDLERQTASQRVLLLAWLREGQTLELQELEAKVMAGRGLLRNLLGDGGEELAPGLTADISSEPDVDPGSALPAWRDVLEAALCFLPPDVQIVVTDRDMAEALLEHASDSAHAALNNWMAIAAVAGQSQRIFLVPNDWV